MSVRFEAVTATIGAEVSGVDLRRPLNDAARDAIREALFAHGVLFFRDQDITPDQHVAFAERFGTISVPPMAPAAGLRPELMVLDQVSCRIFSAGGNAYLGVCERPERVSPEGIIVTLVSPDVHAWHDRLTASNGLRTQWSDTLVAPSRMYGMWQSAQATPLRAWMP